MPSNPRYVHSPRDTGVVLPTLVSQASRGMCISYPITFFSCSVDNKPVVAVEFTHSDNNIFEIRGKNNSVIPKEEVAVISQEIKNAINSLSR